MTELENWTNHSQNVDLLSDIDLIPPQLVDEAVKTADIIAGQSKMSTRMAKEATNAA